MAGREPLPVEAETEARGIEWIGSRARRRKVERCAGRSTVRRYRLNRLRVRRPETRISVVAGGRKGNEPAARSRPANDSRRCTYASGIVCNLNKRRDRLRMLIEFKCANPLTEAEMYQPSATLPDQNKRPAHRTERHRCPSSSDNSGPRADQSPLNHLTEFADIRHIHVVRLNPKEVVEYPHDHVVSSSRVEGDVKSACHLCWLDLDGLLLERNAIRRDSPEHHRRVRESGGNHTEFVDLGIPCDRHGTKPRARKEESVSSREQVETKRTHEDTAGLENCPLILPGCHEYTTGRRVCDLENWRSVNEADARQRALGPNENPGVRHDLGFPAAP